MDKINFDEIDINKIDPSDLINYLLSLDDDELKSSVLKIIDNIELNNEGEIPVVFELMNKHSRITDILNTIMNSCGEKIEYDDQRTFDAQLRSMCEYLKIDEKNLINRLIRDYWIELRNKTKSYKLDKLYNKYLAI